MERTEKLSIEQKSYRYNRKAIKRTEKLSIEQKNYGQIRKAIDRTYIYIYIYKSEVEFVHPVSAGGSVNFLPVVQISTDPIYSLAYDKVSANTASSLPKTSKFQRGDRVLKVVLILCVSMAYTVIECLVFTQNTQILKIAVFAI